jgi:predicted  nucleic acid-binding Zn-ribbon protein
MKPNSLQKKRILLLVLVIAVTILIVSSGIFYYTYSRNKLINQEYDKVESIGKWKLEQINNWHKDLINDIKATASSYFLLQASEFVKTQNQNSKEYIEDRFETIKITGHINYCILLDSNFDELLATDLDHDSSYIYSQTSSALEKSEIFRPTYYF